MEFSIGYVPWPFPSMPYIIIIDCCYSILSFLLYRCHFTFHCSLFTVLPFKVYVHRKRPPSPSASNTAQNLKTWFPCTMYIFWWSFPKTAISHSIWAFVCGFSCPIFINDVVLLIITMDSKLNWIGYFCFLETESKIHTIFIINCLHQRNNRRIHTLYFRTQEIESWNANRIYCEHLNLKIM